MAPAKVEADHVAQVASGDAGEAQGQPVSRIHVGNVLGRHGRPEPWEAPDSAG